MAEAARRRGHHEDSKLYFDASKNRWVGATSLGFSPDGGRRIRQKVRGRPEFRFVGGGPPIAAWTGQLATCPGWIFTT